jgi:hypothetical protein
MNPDCIRCRPEVIKNTDLCDDCKKQVAARKKEWSMFNRNKGTLPHFSCCTRCSRDVVPHEFFCDTCKIISQNDTSIGNHFMDFYKRYEQKKLKSLTT